MDKKVAGLLNDQINKELYSAYLYLDMANFYSGKGLDGFANWYEIQAKEEQDHAMLMYKYLHNNDQDVTLEAIAKPDKVYETLMDPLKAAHAHEQYVTGLIKRDLFPERFTEHGVVLTPEQKEQLKAAAQTANAGARQIAEALAETQGQLEQGGPTMM